MNGARPLQTGRLKLRALAAIDIAFIAGLLGDERVRRFLGGSVPDMHRLAVATGYIDVGPGEATWLVEEDRSFQPVGLVFISNHKDGSGSELSFMFSPSVWGMGYATEAAQKVIDHATGEMGIAHLVAETQAANHASRALLVRLGMSEARRFHRFGAEQILYAL